MSHSPTDAPTVYELRRALNAAEADLEDALRDYERAVRTIDSDLVDPEAGSGAIEVEQTARQTYERCRLELVDALKQLASSPEAKTPGDSAAVAVNRARELLDDYESRFRKMARSAHERTERLALLEESFRRADASGDDGQDTGARARLLMEREREGLEHAHSKLDELLEQASNTGSSLSRQRRSLMNTMGGLVGVAATFPVLGETIRWISSRRRRDSWIIAIVFALCTVFFVWMIVRAIFP